MRGEERKPGDEILERAVDIDQEFALAYRQMSENYHYMGEVEKAQKYAKTALSLKDKVSVRDGFLVEGWAHTILEESYKNAENIYLEMIKSYPDDEDANTYLRRKAYRAPFEMPDQV